MKCTHLITLTLLTAIVPSLHALETPVEQRTPHSLVLLSMQACMRYLASDAGKDNNACITKSTHYMTARVETSEPAALTTQQKLEIVGSGVRTAQIQGHNIDGLSIAGNGAYVIAHDMYTGERGAQHTHIIAAIKPDGSTQDLRQIPYSPLNFVTSALLASAASEGYLTFEPENPFSRIHLFNPPNDGTQAEEKAHVQAQDLRRYASRDKSSNNTWWFKDEETLCLHTYRSPDHAEIKAYKKPHTSATALCTLPELPHKLEIGEDGNTCIYVPHTFVANQGFQQQSAVRVLKLDAYISETPHAGTLVHIDQSFTNKPCIHAIALNKDCKEFATGMNGLLYVHKTDTPEDMPLAFTYEQATASSDVAVEHVAFHPHEPLLISCTKKHVVIHHKNHPGAAIKYIETPSSPRSLACSDNYIITGHTDGNLLLIPMLNDTDLNTTEHLLLFATYTCIKNNVATNILEQFLNKLPAHTQHILRAWHTQREAERATQAEAAMDKAFLSDKSL